MESGYVSSAVMCYVQDGNRIDFTATSQARGGLTPGFVSCLVFEIARCDECEAEYLAAPP